MSDMYAWILGDATNARARIDLKLGTAAWVAAVVIVVTLDSYRADV